MKQRHLLYTELKHFHTHPVSCCLLAASHTYTRCIVQPSLQMDMSSSPEYRHRSSASASVEAKMSVLLLSSARVRLAHPRDSHAERRPRRAKIQSVVSAESLCVFKTVCLHLDGHHVVTGDHGQAQDSGFTLGECVCKKKIIKSIVKLSNLSVRYNTP